MAELVGFYVGKIASFIGIGYFIYWIWKRGGVKT